MPNFKKVSGTRQNLASEHVLLLQTVKMIFGTLQIGTVKNKIATAVNEIERHESNTKSFRSIS
jgi:hypothetical protein